MQPWMRWAIAACVALLVGVVAWRLLAGSYKGDLQKICNGETNAGASMRENPTKVNQWIKDHLDTPEGNAKFSALLEKGVGARAVELRTEAQKYGVASCPIAETYAAMQADGESRADMHAICGGTAADLTKLEELDDDARMQKLGEWMSTKAKSPRTKTLGDEMSKAAAKDRPDVLRRFANDLAVYQCELVDVLRKPQLHARKEEAVIQIGNPDINGDMKTEQFVATIMANMESLRKCYEPALAKNPDLGGRILLKIAVALKTKTNGVNVASSTVADPAVPPCFVKAVEVMKFPQTVSALVTVLAPFDLIPKLKVPQAPPPGADPHGH